MCVFPWRDVRKGVKKRKGEKNNREKERKSEILKREGLHTHHCVCVSFCSCVCVLKRERRVRKRKGEK